MSLCTYIKKEANCFGKVERLGYIQLGDALSGKTIFVRGKLQPNCKAYKFTIIVLIRVGIIHGVCTRARTNRILSQDA